MQLMQNKFILLLSGICTWPGHCSSDQIGEGFHFRHHSVSKQPLAELLLAGQPALSSSRRHRTSAVQRDVPKRASSVRAQIHVDDDDIFSECYSAYTVSFLRDCLLDDGCAVPEECELLSLDDLDMLDTSGSSRILQGRAKHGTDAKPNKNELAKKQRKGKRRRDSARSSGLALALKEGTRNSHSMAENSQFMSGFFKGLSTRSAFSQLVASLYYVYKAMEEAFDYTTDANVQSMDFPELRRVPSLEDDMAYYFGRNWKSEIVPSRATRVYCNQIQTIAQEKPHLLLAHMYTRYIGDLFGGQLMRGMARTSLKLEEGKGTRFYEFDEISSIRQFIEVWYTKLNELDLTDEQKEEIVQEANRVFVLNIGVFEELGGSKLGFLRALSRLLRSGVTLALAKGKGKMQASFG